MLEDRLPVGLVRDGLRERVLEVLQPAAGHGECNRDRLVPVNEPGVGLLAVLVATAKPLREEDLLMSPTVCQLASEEGAQGMISFEPGIETIDEPVNSGLTTEAADQIRSCEWLVYQRLAEKVAMRRAISALAGDHRCFKTGTRRR